MANLPEIVITAPRNITESDIRAIAPHAPKNVGKFVDPLNQHMYAFGIDTGLKVSAFLAQAIHESEGFIYMQEIASGKAYEGRQDLGNIYPGDGVKFKGHGIFQITGRKNHELCGHALGLNLIKDPLLLTQPEYAVKSACWFWQNKNLSVFAENWQQLYTHKIATAKLGRKINGFEMTTLFINGGFNGLEKRNALFQKAKKVFL